MGVRQFGGRYRGRRVLVTGHTGFKGSWLALWLAELGAKVTGVSLDPAGQNHWALLDLEAADRRQDIRDARALRKLVRAARPEVVFHLAAQSLVRRSYRAPADTWSTNVMGTALLLEACREAPGLKAVVAVTTDKVYANQERARGYRESDPLGGHDPYSASKAADEILVESYRKSFFSGPGLLLASARGGNVVGGGDWSEDRLIPDAVRAIRARRPLLVRSPRATRPWQHVLDCLSGYLLLGQRLLEGRRECAAAWNFGPPARDARTVADVLALLKRGWPALAWKQARGPRVHEATLLALDASRARARLRWQPVWGVERALAETVKWYRAHLESGAVLSREQLAAYVQDARAARATWVLR